MIAGARRNAITPLKYDPRRLALAYVLILCGLLFAPFSFHWPMDERYNETRWIVDGNGVEFPGVGAIRSDLPPARLFHELTSGSGLSIEAWLSAASTNQHGPARIISYSKDKMSQNFMIGQEGADLVTRIRTSSMDSTASISNLTIDNVFETGELQHLVVTYDFFHERVYINGQLLANTESIRGNFAHWDPGHLLVLGNEATGNRPWSGKLLFVAIYNQELAASEIRGHYSMGFDDGPAFGLRRITNGLVALYSFNAAGGRSVFDRSIQFPPIDLTIPPTLKVSNKVVRWIPYEASIVSREQFLDIAANIVLFVPLGLLLYMAVRGTSPSSIPTIVLVLMLGAMLSFIAECLQYFLPGRVSSLTDIVNNVFGTGIGITVGSKILNK